MTFYPSEAPVPEGLRNAEFMLRMLRATDVELDYDAVISSREQLLIRSGRDWPVEGFSLAENLADLQHHEQEHLERKAFTYTVMNPTETECLGCIYINPLARLLERLQTSGQAINNVQEPAAYISFWARSSRLADDLDKRLLAALCAWFKEEWPPLATYFYAGERQTRFLQIYQEAGKEAVYTLQGKIGTFQLYQ
jgi:hypothetical protein